MLGEQGKRVLIPLAVFDSVLKGSLYCEAQWIGTGRKAGGGLWPQCGQDGDDQPSILLIWLQPVHPLSNADC